MDHETQFLQGLIELQYNQADIPKLTKIAPKWAQGWPEDKQAFWNAEAFMWSHKINQQTRELILKEIQFLHGKNLDLGCGSCSYIPSIGFDISKKMLQFNDNCTQKIIGNLEKPLPFENNSFESITAIFLLNYIQNYSQLLQQIFRILQNGGHFIIILSSQQVKEWHYQQQQNNLTNWQWIINLKQTGFEVNHYQKQQLDFYICQKQKT